MLDLLGIIKKETVELVEILNSVKIWIQLNIPRIEDGIFPLLLISSLLIYVNYPSIIMFILYLFAYF